MKSHKVSLKVCLANFPKVPDAGRLIFAVISQVKAAILAKSAVIRDMEFISAPSIEDPLGDLGTIDFYIATPYECECHLDIQQVLINHPSCRVYPLVELKIKLI